MLQTIYNGNSVTPFNQKNNPAAPAKSIPGSKFSLLETYWQIGRLIVVEEQQGKTVAQYGTELLKTLSMQLTQELGQGFDYTNLTPSP